MAEGRRVLITGISGQLAGLVAHALEQRDDVAEIVGIDVREPRHELVRTRFVRADVRNPMVARVLEQDRIDTVLHLSTTSSPAEAGGRGAMRERNVMGALQLLAACQRSATVRRFVVRSTTAVYGSGHTDPAFFAEPDGPVEPVKHGFAMDAIEVERYAAELGQRRPDIDVAVLRFANLVGGRVDSSFHRLFSLPVVPTVLGFDPRLQFCHEDDAIAVLVRAATGDHAGVFNVAGDGVLYLSQCVRLAGRVPMPVPVPFVAGVASVVRRRWGGDVSPEQLRFLRYGRVVDTRRLREDLGYEPAYSTQAAFEDFVRRRRLHGVVDRGHVDRLEQELYGFLRRSGEDRVTADGHEGQR